MSSLTAVVCECDCEPRSDPALSRPVNTSCVCSPPPAKPVSTSERRWRISHGRRQYVIVFHRPQTIMLLLSALFTVILSHCTTYTQSHSHTVTQSHSHTVTHTHLAFKCRQQSICTLLNIANATLTHIDAYLSTPT